jgi:hypothetical protein
MDPPRQKIRKWMGPVSAAVAIVIAIFGKPSPGVPAWIAYVACAAFFFVGVVLTAQAFGFPRVAKWLAPLILVTMAVITTWIGFAPGERECTSSFSLLGLGGSGMSSCKPVFAIAAALIWVFLAAVLWVKYLRKAPKN